MGIETKTVEVEQLTATCEKCGWTEPVKVRENQNVPNARTIWDGQKEGRAFTEETVFTHNGDGDYTRKLMILCDDCAYGTEETGGLPRALVLYLREPDPDETQVAPQSDPTQDEIDRLVVIGIDAFVPATTGPDPASMAIHDAASSSCVARKAYTEMVSIIAKARRSGAQAYKPLARGLHGDRIAIRRNA